MKKFLMILPAALLAACATTGASSKPVTDPQIAALQQQLADQQAEIVTLKRSRTVQQIQQQPVQQQLPVGVVIQQTPPPARPAIPGPPQYFGWMHTTPQGCESGVFSLEIHNVTDYYVTVLLDGEEVRPRGAHGALPHMPPHTKIYVCLSHLGEHTLAGVAYGSRMGILAEVDTFSMNVVLDANTVKNGTRQMVHINDSVLWWN